MDIKDNNYIWLDGKILAKTAANISPLTHGLHYGTGAFEGIRIYNGRIFKLKEHIDRLFLSAKILMMAINFSIAEVMEACQQIAIENKVSDGYIRPLIFLGDENIAIGAENKVHLMIACWKRSSPYLKTLMEKKALSLKISSFIKPAAESFLYSTKASGLYVLNHIAKKQATSKGYDDALMLDYRRFIAEATTSNFFMVKANKLYTPIAECCLNGITRQVIIEIAKANDIEVIEKYITPAELGEADEAFLTGTVAEINAISSIAEYKYANNPVSQLLYDRFYQLTQS